MIWHDRDKTSLMMIGSTSALSCRGCLALTQHWVMMAETGAAGNNIDDGLLKTLCLALSKCRDLRSLDLSGNLLTQKGLKTLVDVTLCDQHMSLRSVLYYGPMPVESVSQNHGSLAGSDGDHVRGRLGVCLIVMMWSWWNDSTRCRGRLKDRVWRDRGAK